jgi:hypothetical protein
MTQIQINTHQRVNWTLEDKNNTVALDATYNRLGEPDGFNITVKDYSGPFGNAWLSLEEAKSLRQWLVKALDIA